MSSSFARMATVVASTKRMGAVADGLTGDLVTNIASLKCLPLDPLSAEAAMVAGIDAFVELLQTMVEGGLDILEGDMFYVGDKSYKIRAVGQWNWGPSGTDTLSLMLGEVK